MHSWRALLFSAAVMVSFAAVAIGQQPASAPLPEPAPISLEPASKPADPPAEELPVLPTGGEYIPAEAAKQPKWPFTQRGMDFDSVLGVRQQMSDAGINWRLRIAMLVQNLSSGGLRTAGATAFTMRTNFDLSLDLQKLIKWNGASVYVEMQDVVGTGLSAQGYVGDAFGVNRMATQFDYAIVRRFYFQQILDLSQLLPTLRLRFMMGMMDFRDEFDRNAYTYEYRVGFLNRAIVDDPTIAAREGVLGALLSIETDQFYIRSGAYDATGRQGYDAFVSAFDGDQAALWMIEGGWTPKFDGPNGKLPGNYKIGFWYNGSQFLNLEFNTFGGTLPPARESGDNGFYTSFDQMVYKEVSDANDKQGLGLFFKFGTAQAELSPVSQNFAMGAVYTGLIPGRNDDTLGVAYDLGILPATNREQSVTDEQVFETYYNIAVFPWFTIGPDLQYILHPDGGRNGATDALVVGLRAYMVF